MAYYLSYYNDTLADGVSLTCASKLYVDQVIRF